MKKTFVVMVIMGLAGVLGAAEAAPDLTAKAAEAAVLSRSGRESLMDSKWTEAAALFEKARTLDPASDEAAFGLSAAYIGLKRFEEAITLLEALEKKVPDHPMVRNNLAWALLKARGNKPGTAERAIKLARSALVDVPSDPSIWNTLGEAYFAAGKYDKAMAAARSGLRLSDLAGETNSPCRDLLERCRKAGGKDAAGAAADE